MKLLNKCTLLLIVTSLLTTASCGLIIGRSGSEISPPDQLYPATSVDLEVLSYAFETDDISSGAVFLPFVIIDLPISIITDTLLFPYDVIRLHKTNQKSKPSGQAGSCQSSTEAPAES